jgi:hypothetical protein
MQRISTILFSCAVLLLSSRGKMLKGKRRIHKHSDEDLKVWQLALSTLPAVAGSVQALARWLFSDRMESTAGRGRPSERNGEVQGVWALCTP